MTTSDTVVADADEVTIRNLTARRIEIAEKDAPRSGFIIPPFGERVLAAADLPRYGVDEWREHRLVRIEPRGASQQEGRSRVTVFSYISGYSLLASLALAAWWVVDRNRPNGIAAVLGLVVTAFFAYRTDWHADAWRNICRSFNIFLGLLLAFGAPGVAILHMRDQVRPELEGSPELDLALVLLWLFVAMASVLPAALFLFFHRQKVPTLRNNFLRDVVRLDPNVQTTEDAESTYDALIRDVYGAGTGGASPGRRLPMLAATGVISGLWIWTLVPGLDEATDIRQLLLPEPDVVTFAFLGAYVFAINLLFRRYARADLGPKVYTHIIVRIFAAVVSTWVLSFAPFARDAEGRPRAMMLLLAFFVGIVPETATAIIQDLLQQWKAVGRAVPSLGEDHPLSRLDGMTLYDRSHLLEVGIENIESLAHHNIVDIMLWTRIPTPRLVDFVDQAILYLHLRGPVVATAADGDSDEARRLLARHGIRTATDLERTYALAAARSVEEGERLLALLDAPDLPVHRLRVVLDALGDDEWMINVRNWRDQSAVGEPVRSVAELVEVAARGPVSAVATAPRVATADQSPTAPVRRLEPVEGQAEAE
ncbi:MAG TPA: hypothetical protein VHF00_04500 [Acidimicrobiales bacterium]|nr:hypothetical protein [Acidimicrobiales bacterium]